MSLSAESGLIMDDLKKEDDMEVADFQGIITHPMFSVVVAALVSWLAFYLIRKVISVIVWGMAVVLALGLGAMVLDGATDQPYLDFFPEEMLSMAKIAETLQETQDLIEQGRALSQAAENLLDDGSAGETPGVQEVIWEDPEPGVGDEEALRELR